MLCSDLFTIRQANAWFQCHLQHCQVNLPVVRPKPKIDDVAQWRPTEVPHIKRFVNAKIILETSVPSSPLQNGIIELFG